MITLRRWTRVVPAAAAALSVMTATLEAQNSNLVQPADQSTSSSLGWIVTPAIAVSTAWDDNVFVQGQGDPGTSDLVNVVNPRINASYTGPRTQLGLNYSGAFLLYRDFNALNSFDQRASLNGRRRLTPHVTLFVDNAFAIVPTTEMSALVGVPFVRTGSTLDDFRTGLEAALTKKTMISVAGDFQWVAFDRNPAFASQLHGGHGFGGEASLHYRISERTAIIADYRLQDAVISDTGENFIVQTTGAGLEHRFTELVTAYGELGVSRLVTTIAAESRTGPSIRAGIARHGQRTTVDVAYSRSFVPSYGFGGTTQNEEVTASLSVPLSRRVSVRGGAAARRNEPLTIGQPSLRSLWFEGSIGYDWLPIARIEVFYGGAHQIVDRPGGVVNRNRVGVQILTARRMRVH